MPFEFPRDPKSANDHITMDAMGSAVRNLTAGLEDQYRGGDDLAWLNDGMTGWNVVKLLQFAGACAFVRGSDPETDYDAALVRQALIDYGHVAPAKTMQPA